MLDDIFRGVLSGLITPPLIQWAKKYSYRIVFIVAAVGMQAYFIIRLVYDDFGWLESIRKSLTPLVLCISLASGVFAVFCVFLCRLTSPKKDDS